MGYNNLLGTEAGTFFPFGFSAQTEAVGSAHHLGHWIVGIQLDHGGVWRKDIPLFTGQEPDLRRWFEQCINFGEPPFDPVSWISQNGAFRKLDWKPVKHVRASKVRKEAERLGLGPEDYVYLLRADHVHRELALLRYLAEIAGALKEKKWSKLKVAMVKAHELSYGLRAELQQGIYGPWDGKTIPELKVEPVTKEGRSQVYEFVGGAISRILEHSQIKISANPKGGPTCTVHVEDVLSLLYICFLSDFSKGWAKCRRPDCPQFFLVFPKDRIYCSQQCGNTDSKRRKREEARRKIKPKTKGGKK